ncbi:uncharacterized protein LOC116266528 isoform X2 [Nymphaea colorata]|uniref:uncharacterized protein LOC116266528 isoform X2 n=1 Tax=Nymphaea colorata TaxID=210225 RepID=UPI00129D9303|nr:uncharacterized protein LOC116266528 isoform X2 [Nymphaea colorata]
MMAAAEARAAWQRTANRCFVQEDAKRAPKLASCPSASSKLQQDQCAGDGRNGVDHSGTYVFLPVNWSPSNSKLSPDTKWWLQLQPNFGNRRDFIFEQLKALDVELDCMASFDMDPSSEPSNEATQTAQCRAAEPEKVRLPVSGAPCRVSTTCLNREFESKAHGLKATNSVEPLKHEMNLSDSLKTESSEEMPINQKQLDHLTLEQREKDAADISAPRVTDRTGPWWRITDKDELASLVTQSSFRCIENCDLPRPLNSHTRSQLDDVDVFHDEELIPSSFDHKICSALHNAVGDPQPNPFSGSAKGAQWLPAELDPSADGLEKNSRVSSRQFGRSEHNFGVDASKAQLLEALCHSQTRARKAENAAQRAHSEKEHILRLFLKQATHLFAYKQLFRLLQLESIYLQIECKNTMVPWDQLSALFPWLATRDEQSGETGSSKKRKRSSESSYDVGRLAFAVAIGMSLAGAGLFLGWTLGWLLSTF